MSTKIRNSRIELLRIISMFLIVYDHIIIFTNWNLTNDYVRDTILEIPTIGGKLGVNIFFLITGYFLIKKNNYRFNGTIKIILTTLFYSWIGVLISYLFKLPGISWKLNFQGIFPIEFGSYWFITVYVFLMLIYPYINKLVINLTQIQYFFLLILGFVCLFIWSCFFSNKVSGISEGSTLLTGVYVYLLGGYIRLHNKTKDLYKKNIINLTIFFLSLILMIVSIFLINILQVHGFLRYGLHKYMKFIDGDSPLQLIASMAIFIYTIDKPSFENKFINIIASTSLAVYILDTNISFRHYMYDFVIQAQKLQFSNYIYLYCLIVSIFIFLIFITIELIRQLVMRKTEDNLSIKISNYLLRIISKLYQFLIKKINK
ncbi:MAG: acyltransferase [Lactobacillus sp.]|nr:acyltransferase [Lactobacillus sp.]